LGWIILQTGTITADQESWFQAMQDRLPRGQPTIPRMSSSGMKIATSEMVMVMIVNPISSPRIAAGSGSMSSITTSVIHGDG
jgi:hypothetical protein